MVAANRFGYNIFKKESRLLKNQTTQFTGSFRFDGLMKMKTATRLSLNVYKASKKVNGTSDYAMAA